MTYKVRRIAKTHPNNVWEVAGLLRKICGGYEESGRSKAQIYIKGWGVPGVDDVAEVVAEWTQEVMEPNTNVTDEIWQDHLKLSEMLVGYPIELSLMGYPARHHRRCRVEPAWP